MRVAQVTTLFSKVATFIPTNDSNITQNRHVSIASVTPELASHSSIIPKITVIKIQSAIIRKRSAASRSKAREVRAKSALFRAKSVIIRAKSLNLLLNVQLF
jgi:hypothetical protein